MEDDDRIADTPKELLEFLAGRMEYAGIADGVAKSYAKEIRRILKEYYSEIEGECEGD